MQAFHPAFAASVKFARAPLSDDPDTAVAQTIETMGRYVREDRSSRFFQSLAAQLRGQSHQQTKRNVFAWIKARVRFVNDSVIADLLRAPESDLDKSSIAEVLIRPLDIVRMVDPMGDCDDFSMLGACLLTAAGVHCAFVTLAADAREPSQYSHVYLVAEHEPFDSSHGPFVGWEARNRFGKRQLWSVETGMPITDRPGFGLGRAGFLGDTTVTPDITSDGQYATINYSYPTISMPAIAPPSDAGFFSNLDSSLEATAASIGIPTGLNTGGGGALPLSTGSGGTPWWSSLISGALGTASSILKMQYLPQNAVIQTRPGSFIATGTAATSGGLAIGAGSSSSWLWIIIAVVGAFLLLKKK
jgi:hypothetical protein